MIGSCFGKVVILGGDRCFDWGILCRYQVGLELGVNYMDDTVLMLTLLSVGLFSLYWKKSLEFEHLDGISVKRRWEGEHGVKVSRENDEFNVV